VAFGILFIFWIAAMRGQKTAAEPPA
jgi:hypothetical protein